MGRTVNLSSIPLIRNSNFSLSYGINQASRLTIKSFQDMNMNIDITKFQNALDGMYDGKCNFEDPRI